MLEALAIVLTLMTLLWLLSLVLRNASIVDIFWGSGFVISALYYFGQTEGYLPRKIMVLALVVVWGLRLTAHIWRRNHGKPEDFRYMAWRRQHGRNWWWRSYLQVFLLQGLILWVVSLSLWAAMSNPAPGPAWSDGIGLLLWSLGFFFESVGDWQLVRFKADPSNRGKLLTHGLWKYTRHPNYFGDALVWWGFYLLGLPGGLWTIFAPALMTFLLVRVSGVAMLERTMKERPGYEDYLRSTPAFFPRLPRRK